MCGIFGISMLNGSTVTNNTKFHKFIAELFKETSVRGSIASGISVVKSNEALVIKKDVSAREFVESKSYKDMIKANVDLTAVNNGVVTVFGHGRFPTKGTEKVEHNNHPIVAEHIIGVHNGCISNDDRLFAEYMEKNQCFKRAGEVDSEIIFRLINHYTTVENLPTKKALEKLNLRIHGSYACIFVNTLQPYYVWLFRNNQPTTILLYDKVGLLVYASVKKHILDAVSSSGLELGEPVDLQMEPNEAVGFNLFSNIHTKFELNEKTNFMGHA
jgi:glucosamine 6-phosphate synthetase-like amidotransferase/phosphosugar isomerase protein